MERRTPVGRGHDWETSPNRHRLLVKILATILGSMVYAALVFLVMAMMPPRWTAITGIAAYLLYLVILAVLLWDEVRRKRAAQRT